MQHISSPNIAEIYDRVLLGILRDGDKTFPRRYVCKELHPVVLELSNPCNNILTSPLRKANKAFMGAEFMWMLWGRNDVRMIEFYNKNIAKFSDDGDTFFGAYGPKITEQLGYVYQKLTTDPSSRQAVINIWRESPHETKDVPCTLNFIFMVRQGCLDMTVTMRSQDAWLGLPYDIHNFTCFQMLLAGMLGYRVGKFYMMVNSLHLYSNDLIKAEEYISDCPAWQFESTPLSSCSSLDQLQKWIKVMMQGEQDFRVGKSIILSKEWYDPFFYQKMNWMNNYARKKHELADTKNT